jgi:hypothetical protein
MGAPGRLPAQRLTRVGIQAPVELAPHDDANDAQSRAKMGRGSAVGALKMQVARPETSCDRWMKRCIAWPTAAASYSRLR